MRSHDVFSKLDDKRQILTDGNLDIPTQTLIVFTLLIMLKFIEMNYYLLIPIQNIGKEDPIWIFIIISDNINMLNTLFALPGNYIFLCALKLYDWGLLNGVDFCQPHIFATPGSFFSILWECPSFYVGIT